jgi:hypothetical protein
LYGAASSLFTPDLTLNIILGKIGCSPFPSPFSYSNKNISQSSAASLFLGIPKFIELNGTCEPALE